MTAKIHDLLITQCKLQDKLEFLQRKRIEILESDIDMLLFLLKTVATDIYEQHIIDLGLEHILKEYEERRNARM